MTPTWLKSAALALLLPLAACNQSPEARADLAMRQMEAQEPIFALIRQHEPTAYADLRALIEREMRTNGGAMSPQLIQRARAILAQTVVRRLKAAPDELVVDFTRFVADQSDALEAKPEICAAVLNGTAGDVREHVSAAMQEREKGLYERLLTAPQTAAPKVATQEDVQPIMAAFAAEASAALNLTEDQLYDALDGKGGPRAVCQAAGRLMRHISQMPPAAAGPIYRLLVQYGEEA